MSKGRKVKANTSWMGRVKKGEVFIVVRSFFANGEEQLALRPINGGEIKVLPDVFFDKVA